MSHVPDEHRRTSPESVDCAVLTVSDTRTFDTDTGGATAVERLTAAGHRVLDRRIVPDDPQVIEPLLAAWARDDQIEAVLATGGTGISGRDQTYETVRRLLTKELPGYGELFRWLSFQQIGAAAMLSRATGGLIGRCVVLLMPGSPAAVRLAMDELIVPELGHLVREARRGEPGKSGG